MLTKELLQVTKRRPNIRPVYREIDEYRDVAERVITAYEEGKRRKEIQDACADLETHDMFKFVRGLSTLMERRSIFEQQAPVDPRELRRALFERGYVADSDERAAAVADIADAFDITEDGIKDGFWADLERNEVLVDAAQPAPDELIKQYNLSLTQTLLFDAHELRFNVSGNFQEIFGLITYLGLMYTVDEDKTVHVTGPASLLKRTRKYGTTLAKLVPAITAADEWRIEADVETEVGGEQRVYQFELTDEQESLFPESSTDVAYDSAVEKDFAERLRSVTKGWTINREPTILRAGTTVMIPDFSFERNGQEFYLEVVGFWTPEYLEEKITKVRNLDEEDIPLMIAVDESLNCTEQDFAGADEVIFYDKQIPVKPVVDRMKQIAEEQVATDYEQLMQRDQTAPDERVRVADTAAKWETDEQAAQRYLEEQADGIVSSGTYLPPDILDEIRERIDTLDDRSFAAVQDILAEYDAGNDVLDHIGYTISWNGLSEADAVVEKKE